MTELPLDFIHDPPKGYSYEVDTFKRNLISIWIINHGSFSYTDEKPKCIWGFYNTKTKRYFAPVNSKKMGKEVDIKSTTPFSSMQLNLKGLESLWI